MKRFNPYQVTLTSVDSQQCVIGRPMYVTIALVILWILLTCAVLGSVAQLSKPLNPGAQESVLYVAYLALMIFVPAFLLVKVARASNWARVALLILYGINFLFRIYLFVNDGQFTVPVAAWVIVPAAIQAIAFGLLFLPGSSKWFASKLMSQTRVSA